MANHNRRPYPNPFDPLTPSSAWALGLFFTDGCIYTKTVSITQKDRTVLDQVKKIIAPPDEPERVKVTPYVGKSSAWVLRVASMDLMDYLASYGVGPRKSRTIEWPERLAPGVLSHFVRGLWDGDGWIGENQTRFSMVFASGSPMFLKGMLHTLSPFIGERRSVYKQRLTNCSVWNVSGVRALAFARWMYAGSSADNRIAYKFDKFERWNERS